jgi:hypothetical protein
MSNKQKSSRREFLKTSAASAAGIAAVTVIPRNAFAADGGAWHDGDQINSQIDNLRVVCCTDSTMANGNPGSTFASQNNAVVSWRVSANLDAMAMSLSQKATADLAWSTIFQKPAAKAWSAVKVAFKVNTINNQLMPHVAIITKIANVLNALGVPYANMIIYDGCNQVTNYSYTTYPNYLGTTKPTTSYTGALLPAGMVVSNFNSALGGEVMSAVPGWNNQNCSKDIAEGAVDILINCAVNKGHGNEWGGCSITMKNHFGTFNPKPSNNAHGDLTYLTGINKAEAIIGGTPKRQQLCIVDSIWAATTGPTDPPDTEVFSLVMGTFGPAIDYLVIKNIREAVMSVTHPAATINQYLTAFGYTTTQPVWVNVQPAAVRNGRLANRSGAILTVNVFDGAYLKATTEISIPSVNGNCTVSINDLSGRLVRIINPQPNGHNLVASWDGRDALGGMARTGLYTVMVKTEAGSQTGTITLAR